MSVYTEHTLYKNQYACMLYVLLQQAGFKENMLVLQSIMCDDEESRQGNILQLEIQSQSKVQFLRVSRLNRWLVGYQHPDCSFMLFNTFYSLTENKETTGKNNPVKATIW